MFQQTVIVKYHRQSFFNQFSPLLFLQQQNLAIDKILLCYVTWAHWIAVAECGERSSSHREKCVDPAGNRTPAVRPIRHCYTDQYVLCFKNEINTNLDLCMPDVLQLNVTGWQHSRRDVARSTSLPILCYCSSDCSHG
jgi:hypothetical protein